MRFPSPGIAPAAARAALLRSRNDLCTRVATLRAQPDDIFLHDFSAVVTAVEAGFRHEEALLELLGDAGLHPRRADHAVILCALHRTLPQVEGGDIALGRQVAEALDAVLTLPLQTASVEHAVDRTAGQPAPRRHVGSRQRPAARTH
jgi:hypothetical protein